MLNVKKQEIYCKQWEAAHFSVFSNQPHFILFDQIFHEYHQIFHLKIEIDFELSFFRKINDIKNQKYNVLCFSV
jgi:hypothetical protein